MNAGSFDAIDATVSVDVPALETRKLWSENEPMDTLPNAMLGEAIRMRDCSIGIPVPLRETVVGLPAALCAIDSVPDFAP